MDQEHTHTLVRFGGGLPVLGTDDGQADLALLVDVGVVDLGLEGDLWGLKGVLRREVDLNPEGPLVIGRIVLEQRPGLSWRETRGELGRDQG